VRWEGHSRGTLFRVRFGFSLAVAAASPVLEAPLLSLFFRCLAILQGRDEETETEKSENDH
jgi:hypothetical protein